MLAVAPLAAAAEIEAAYYKDKTITLYIGSSPGTGYDLTARLLARFMPAEIPGNPTIVPRNMPGGGSRIAAGYVYNVAPRDGTAFALMDQSVPLQQAIGEKLQFDITQFTWIGNSEAGVNVVLTWYRSGVASIEDAKRREVTIGSSGSGSSRQPLLMNALLGTRFRIVSGYP